MKKIMLVDDQVIVIEGMKTILESDPELTVVETAVNGQDCMDKLGRLFDTEAEPDLILMDLKMPVMNGVQTTRAIKAKYNRIPVVNLTTYADEQWVLDAVKSGASGYLLKDMPRKELIAAVKGTISGIHYIDPHVAGTVLHATVNSIQTNPGKLQTELPEKEIQIIKLIARGFSNSQIGDELYLAPGTVKNYTSAIFEKLGVKDRTQAAVTALRLGLIQLDEI